MSLQAFLEWFTQGCIVVLAGLMVVQWARWRDRVSLDIVLVFGSLALVLILVSAVLAITIVGIPIAIPFFLLGMLLLIRSLF